MTSAPGSAAEDRALTDAVAQASFAMTALLTRVGAAHDLSLTQVRVLAILRNHEPTMAQLADHLGLDRSTVSGLVDRAAKRGLVERVSNDEDRRSSRVRLTAAGRRLAEDGADEISEAVAAMAVGLDVDERRTLRDLLARMRPA
ncbi:MarR family transcriptional regulator [Nocardioides sp. CN2-186]|uniref:MarR family winged helix-turn-helix transcriptional regulator n=1 Tax=Nocardioides tweenelious TaxID=3156607 RepID=UPI0032B42717